MEAKVQKKPLEGKFNTWRNRLWRIRDRRLICYKAECTEWDQCIQSKIKLEVDIAKMTSASFHPKNNPKPNQLLIKHPKIAEAYGQGAGGGLILRFQDKEETMAAWLKVLTSWSVDKEKNRIYVAIPSNFSYAMWSILNALYEHPDLLKSEGVFRKDQNDSRKKQLLVNDLLYERVSITEIKQKYKDENSVYLLANGLKYLLTMLPSSIFGDQNFEELMEGIKVMGIGTNEKKNNQDEDITKIPQNKLLNLKARIDAMYASSKYKHRYGLISLILHLLKQVSENHKATRMTCDALANMFSMCFESKEWQQTSLLRNPMTQLRSIPLVKLLIFHSKFLFPSKEWQMNEIVVAEAVEAKTLELYHELQLTKKQRRARVKSMEELPKPPPTKHFDRQASINFDNLASYEEETTEQSTEKSASSEMKSDALTVTKPKKTLPKQQKQQDTAAKKETEHVPPPPPGPPPPPSKPVPTKPKVKPPPPQKPVVPPKPTKPTTEAAQIQDTGTKSRNETQAKTGTKARNETVIEKKVEEKQSKRAKDEQKKREEAEAREKKIHIENLQLKGQILELQMQMRQKDERCSDLEHQVQLKDKVLKKLNQQVIDGKIQEMERLLAEKDGNIQTLRQKVLQLAQKEAEKQTAPMALKFEERYYDREPHGLTLEAKLKQRPSWVELNQRGILLDNPQEADVNKKRKKHRRSASQKLRSMLEQRPTKEELEENKIWREEAASKMIDDAVKEALVGKLNKRPDWKEVQQRGILYDAPNEEPHESVKRRKDHKRNASLTVNEMLQNRPSPADLEAHDIIDSQTAALFFGATPQEIVTEDPRTKEQTAERLDKLLAQRPKLDEDGMLLISTNAQLKDYESEIATLRNEMSRLKLQSKELEQTNQSISNRAQKHQRKESEATEELAQLGKQLHEDSMQLEYLKEENQRMSLAYDLAKEDGEKYREEATELKERIEELEQRTNKTQENEDLLTEAHERLEELDTKVQENERLQNELAIYQKEKERMEVEYNMQQQHYIETKQLNKELEEIIAKEREKIKHLSQTLDTTDVSRVVQEKEWEEEIDQLKDKLTNEAKEKSELEEERTQLIAKLNTVESKTMNKISERDAILQDERERVQTLQRELEQVKQSMNDESESMQQMNDLRKELDALREENEMFQSERKGLEQKQIELNRKSKEKENEFASKMEKFRENEALLKDEIQKFKNSQDSFVKEIDTLRKSKTMLVVSTSAEIDALRSQIKMFSNGNWDAIISVDL